MNSMIKVKSRSVEQKKVMTNSVNVNDNQNEYQLSDGSKMVKKRANSSEPKTKRVKRVKDPNAPKKAMTAFILFGNEERPKLKAKRPELTFGEIGKELGKQWKALTEESKLKYKAMAEKEKQRYEKEMQTYKQF
jgi:hypothetical protein